MYQSGTKLCFTSKQDRAFQIGILQYFCKTLIIIYRSANHGAIVFAQFPVNSLQQAPTKGIRQHMFFLSKTNIDRYQMMLRFPTVVFLFFHIMITEQCFFDTLSGLL